MESVSAQFHSDIVIVLLLQELSSQHFSSVSVPL